MRREALGTPEGGVAGGIERWRALRGFADETPALVLGNSPTRLGEEERIHDFPGLLIACNSYWREAREARTRSFEATVGKDDRGRATFLRHRPIASYVGRDPDFLCCYDGIQIASALVGTRGADFPIVCPDPRAAVALSDRYVDPDWWAYPRLAFASPFSSSWSNSPAGDPNPWVRANYLVSTPQGGVQQEQILLDESSGWTPSQLVCGNMSGLLAFQFAVHLGCSPIYLLGIDVGGPSREDGTVDLSACPPTWEGYQHSSETIRLDEAEEFAPGCYAPDAWDLQVTFWKVVTRRAEQLGIPVYRMKETGALDWIPVRQNVGADAEERIPTRS